jgi:hypothetical protein
MAGETINLVEVWNDKKVILNEKGNYRLVAEFAGESSFYEIQVINRISFNSIRSKFREFLASVLG